VSVETQTARRHTPEVGLRCGRYELLERLGAGGMGEVYRARDLELLRDVAVKFLPEPFASSPVRLARFTREARTASALNHPNILTVHDVGQAEGLHFMVTELVEGVTLRQLLRAESRLPTRRALDLAAQMAEGLAKAHAAGIVHRDLKPENVMVTPEGRLKILDFGVAKLHNPTAREDRDTALSELPTWPSDHRPDAPLSDGTLVGTVGYVSPEQARGRPLDHRSDQFALGTTLYEMVTGRRAFRRESRTETLAAIIADEPEPIAGLIPEFPAPARWILECCLAKDPADRYASTSDLAHALRSLRDHLSEVERGEPAVSATRWTAQRLRSIRHRLRPEPRRVAASVAVLALLTMGLVHGETARWARSLWSPPERTHFDAGPPVGADPNIEDPFRDDPLLETMTFRWTRLEAGSSVADPGDDGDPRSRSLEQEERESATVVEGRVERRGDWVRITARLEDAERPKGQRGSAPQTGELLAVAAAMADLLAGGDETAEPTRGPPEGGLVTSATQGEPVVRGTPAGQ
jgi:serine/threonine protein kinase